MAPLTRIDNGSVVFSVSRNQATLCTGRSSLLDNEKPSTKRGLDKQCPRQIRPDRAPNPQRSGRPSDGPRDGTPPAGASTRCV